MGSIVCSNRGMDNGAHLYSHRMRQSADPNATHSAHEELLFCFEPKEQEDLVFGAEKQLCERAYAEWK